jgi:hypothetical protein
MFQEYWDAILEGDTAQRRKAKFVPGKMAPTFTADPKLKDEYDEWLARVICYCFSLPPLPFVKMQNRATSETQYETAKEEGLIPLMLWTQDLINFIIVKYFKITDLEFAWIQEEDIDPVAQAQIMDTKLKAGCISRNEIRKQDGLEPLENGDEILFYGAMGIQREEEVFSEEEPVNTLTQQIPPAKEVKEPLPAEKLAKVKKKVFRQLSRERTSVMRATRELKKLYTKFFKKEGDRITTILSKAIGKVNKADEDIVKKILKEIEWNGWTVLIEPTEEFLKKIYQEAGNYAIKNLITLDLPVSLATENLTDLVSATAADFAKQRAAEMVGRKWIEGKLLDNPNAEWAITESTRDAIREKVVAAIDEGWSPKHLADEIEKAGIFSEDRAELVARTEIKNADNQGNLESYKATGLDLEKSWQVSADHPGDDECLIGETGIINADIKKGFERSYTGPLVCFYLSSGKKLTGTPNHPVLTDRGWKPFKDIHEGDNLVSADWLKRMDIVTNYFDQMESVIQDKVRSFGRRLSTRPCTSTNFHGDGIGSHVYTVRTNSTLDFKIQKWGKQFIKPLLGNGIKMTPVFSCDGNALMSSRHPGLPLFGSTFTRLQGSSIFARSQSEPYSPKSNSNSGFSNSALVGNFRTRKFFSEIKSGKIISGIFSETLSLETVSRRVDFTDSVHVFNLHTSSGLIIAENIITSNCDENESEGWIDIDETFPSGDESPGAHPNCMCSLGVRVKEQEE